MSLQDIRNFARNQIQEPNIKTSLVVTEREAEYLFLSLMSTSANSKEICKQFDYEHESLKNRLYDITLKAMKKNEGAKEGTLKEIYKS